MRRWTLIPAVLVLAACAQEEPRMVENAGPAPGSRAWKVLNARSAAPYEVASGARVLDWAAHDTLPPDTIELGSNGWTCFPNDPRTPADDPICADEMSMTWFGAYAGRAQPRIAAMGVSYMLKGGAAASDTDPHQMQPDTGASWLTDPPHLMIFMPNPRVSFAGLPTTRTATAPWVMWSGTPYAHLMVPAGMPAPVAAPAAAPTP